MDPGFDREAWLAELAAAREDAAQYYLQDFDWRGKGPPEGFEGPRFYPPDERWRVQARLDRRAPGTGTRVELLTSIGDLREFDIYGSFLFIVDGSEQRLVAYSPVPPYPDYDALFVPFRDATSARETYGGGRYMDVLRRDGDDYILDFNTAYNPSCAYSPRYNCPYPPPENHLEIAVEAGEKLPFAH